MYFNFLGGSALLHLLAAHPKVIAVLGIATTVGMLSTSMGPRQVLGAGQQMRSLERSIARSLSSDDAHSTAAINAAIEQGSREDQVQAVHYALAQCGSGCKDLTPASVLRDARLLNDALIVAAIDRSRTHAPLSTQEAARLLARR